MRKIVPACVLSAFVFTGCFERPVVDAPEETKTKTAAADEGGKSAKSKRVPARTSMEGLWLVQMSYQLSQQEPPGWIPMVLLKITRSSTGKYVPVLVGQPPQSKGLRISQFDIGEKTANVVLTRAQAEFDIRVAFYQSDVRGNLVMNSAGLNSTIPTRMIPVSEARMERFKPTPHQHLEEFDRAMRRFHTQQGSEALEAFIKKHPRHPLACYATYGLSPLMQIRKLDSPRPDPKEVREHLKRLDGLEAVWGRRAAVMSRLEYAFNLLQWRLRDVPMFRKNINLDVASKIIRETEAPERMQLLTDAQKARLVDMKKYIELEQNAAIVLTGTDPERRKAALTDLKDFLKTAPPYVPWLMYVVAEGDRRAGRDDEAIRRYAQLLVMPSAMLDVKFEIESRWLKMPDLRKRLDTLWTKKKGRADGLEDYLSAAYEAMLREIRPAVVATKPAAQRRQTHLCELFTSCDDPLCVGASIAAELVQRTHSAADVVVLQYHLDAPQPNPLVCNDAKLRVFDYQIPGMPWILVDGKPIAPRYQFNLQGAPLLNAYMRRAFRGEPAAEAANYAVRVSATHVSGKLAIKAEVDGPMKANPDLRLRLVLAEDRIVYQGANGVRYHEMVVRSMPGGIDGKPLVAGKTTFSTTIDLAELSSRLKDFLTSLEANQKDKLKLKPIGFRKLHVVAFVQHSGGRRDVLQVAQTVVDGLGGTTGTPKKAKAAKPSAPTRKP